MLTHKYLSNQSWLAFDRKQFCANIRWKAYTICMLRKLVIYAWVVRRYIRFSFIGVSRMRVVYIDLLAFQYKFINFGCVQLVWLSLLYGFTVCVQVVFLLWTHCVFISGAKMFLCWLDIIHFRSQLNRIWAHETHIYKICCIFGGRCWAENQLFGTFTMNICVWCAWHSARFITQIHSIINHLNAIEI